MQLITVSI